MGPMKAMVAARTRERKQEQREPIADSLYKKVFQVIESNRSRIKPGEHCKEIKCPVCGGHTAFVIPRESNNAQTCIAACSRGCFACWE